MNELLRHYVRWCTCDSGFIIFQAEFQTFITSSYFKWTSVFLCLSKVNIFRSGTVIGTNQANGSFFIPHVKEKKHLIGWSRQNSTEWMIALAMLIQFEVVRAMNNSQLDKEDSIACRKFSFFLFAPLGHLFSSLSLPNSMLFFIICTKRNNRSLKIQTTIKSLFGSWMENTANSPIKGLIKITNILMFFLFPKLQRGIIKWEESLASSPQRLSGFLHPSIKVSHEPVKRMIKTRESEKQRGLVQFMSAEWLLLSAKLSSYFKLCIT